MAATTPVWAASFTASSAIRAKNLLKKTDTWPFRQETPEGLRRQWNAGVSFPLVNDLAKALPVALEFGIQPLQ